MANNKKLRNAQAEKNGEYYTEYNTISDEIGHYRDQFRGQTVYCNCDDPSWSNFWRYFHSNFASLGLKKLISTHYQKDAEPSYAMVYEGGDDFNMDVGRIVEIHGNTAIVDGKEVSYTAGDFRSDACLKYLDESTVVVTNPPFFLFQEYLDCLMRHNKKFLILGNQNAITKKEIFPLVKENKVWYGASIHSGGINFRIPDDYETYSKKVFIENGHHYINLAGIRWFTNMDVNYRHDGLWHKNGRFDNSKFHYYYEGNEELYPTYDNYPAIEIGHWTKKGDWEGSTEIIPIDYDGIMGVPITFLDKFNPDEFEIIDINPHFFTIVEQGLQKPKQLTLRNAGHQKDPYARLLIRNLHPIAKKDDKGY